MAGAKRKQAAAKKPTMAVKRACFLEALRQTANVSRAAREAGLSSSTVYGMRARIAAFRRDWDAALAEALDELEGHLMGRATQGVDRPVFYRGEVVGNVRTYSDALAMFLLRAKRPEVYDRLAGGARAGAAADTSEEAARAEVSRRLDRLAEDDAGDAEGAAS